MSTYAAEKHFSPAELAEAWGPSPETIRNIFREEPGVLRVWKNRNEVPQRAYHVADSDVCCRARASEIICLVRGNS